MLARRGWKIQPKYVVGVNKSQFTSSILLCFSESKINPCFINKSSYKRLRRCLCLHKWSSDLLSVTRAFLYVVKCGLKLLLRHKLNTCVWIAPYFFAILHDKYAVIFWSIPLSRCWYYLGREADVFYEFELWTKQSKHNWCEEHGSPSGEQGIVIFKPRHLKSFHVHNS